MLSLIRNYSLINFACKMILSKVDVTVFHDIKCKGPLNLICAILSQFYYNYVIGRHRSNNKNAKKTFANVCYSSFPKPDYY